MKLKIYLLTPIFIFFVLEDSYSQWTVDGSNVYTNGNVGIGTSTDLDANLSITGTSWQLKLFNDGIGGSNWRIGSSSDIWMISGGKFLISNSGTSTDAALVIDSQKRVGIGIINPSSLLSVSGDIALKYGSELKTPDGTYRTILKTGWHNSQDFLAFYVPGDVGANATPKIHIKSDGNVGIGTTVPDCRLTVNGKIHAEEVKVGLNVPGPDYVFEHDYELRSLEQTERFVRENKHLPEIPSAAEMEKNGIYLSEMNMKLLKKIEELTLHMININKEMKRLSKENEMLKEKIK